MVSYCTVRFLTLLELWIESLQARELVMWFHLSIRIDANQAYKPKEAVRFINRIGYVVQELMLNFLNSLFTAAIYTA